jgi:hypothetical protein
VRELGVQGRRSAPTGEIPGCKTRLAFGGTAIAWFFGIPLGCQPMIHRGRFTASLESNFVVFLIGMRIDRPLTLSCHQSVLRASRHARRTVC